MTSATAQRAGFGRRKQPITFVMARGETVRHVTVDHRHAIRGGVIAALTGLLLGGLAYYGLADGANPKSPSDNAVVQSYETRLATLRTQLDEATSRHFVAQKMVESKVDVLLTQQEIIAERYERLEPILERARDNGILPAFASYDTPVPTPRPTSGAGPVDAVSPFLIPLAGPPASSPTPTAATTALHPETLREQTSQPAFEPDLLDPIETASLRQSTVELSPAALTGFGRAMDHAELRQIADLRILTTEAIERSTQIAAVLTSVGIEPDIEAPSALGGPFEPAPEDAGFESHYAELDSALDRLEGLRGLSEALPFVAPMAKSRMTSRFGVRSDPFLGRRALHAGVDYAARSGTPIRATASGTVVRAGRAGGYGNLVEIDHGNGLTTRFGHMSRIDVKVGDAIERGAQIGAVGTTGRSTGPHLHYEVRRDGKALDPMRYIRAGQKLNELS